MSWDAFARVQAAVGDIADGRPVVVVDDADRENEGDLIFAAEMATPALVAFMVRHTSGYICVPLPVAECERLDLPPMYHTNQDRRGTAYSVTVDARKGTSTGISAADRARTIRLLASAEATAVDFTRPGHVVPLRAVEGGVLRRVGHTEAAVDLARLAGLRPAGALCELVNDDGTMQRLPDLMRFAAEHGLTLASIADLIAYRRYNETLIERVAQTRITTRYGDFWALGYRGTIDSSEHVALVCGDIGDGDDVLVYVHSECFLGDVIGSVGCDCASQLDAALATVTAEGRGIVLYVRGPSGHGLGLLQDCGFDTLTAGLEPGVPTDAYGCCPGAQILVSLGVRSLRLLAENVHEASNLEGYGLRVIGQVAPPLYVNSAYRHSRELRVFAG
jgi:3,4-dihydroxy 2-butanone 4-phosphate synthase/GTP cyclohydrolase II